MTNIDVVFGHEAKEIAEKMSALLLAKDCEMNVHYCASKIGLIEYLSSRKKSDWLILWEAMPSGPYKAEDFVWLHEEFNVNIIPLLSIDRLGTEYMRELYNGGILTAEFPERVGEKQLPEILTTLILRGRPHETAKVYYQFSH